MTVTPSCLCMYKLCESKYSFTLCWKYSFMLVSSKNSIHYQLYKKKVITSPDLI